ncbi:ATP-binding protein [Streptomyces panaciradicis]|uniref:ATP-binding protein n=1 Tax=Streptomyces panaciradicis TaxID=1470261 RepID=UPI00201CD1C6|nr:tetratricopeptide repeat protein [Streptomyces panaciradicis]MCL6675173.1 tetratricopeptide repeat protein [Streptomyces panaciradicis]
MGKQNDFSGQAQFVVQAGVINGDIHVSPKITAPKTVPRQLPRAATHFTDRIPEAERLDALVRQASGLVVVSGQAGVGKSALVVQWAHQISGQFPDGQLFTDLRGFHARSPQRPEEALYSFLLALNAPMEGLQGSVDAMSALFRSELHGKRMLIVADNARDARQITPLIPGAPGCFMIVTSRNDLDTLQVTEGAGSIRVRPLHHRDAFVLFNRLCGQSETQQVAELIKQCGSLPLTVRIAAQQTHDPSDIRSLVQEFSNTSDRLSAMSSPDEEMGMRTVLSWSYDGLNVPKARAFRLLALHAGSDFSVESAAALFDTTHREATRLLRSLKSDNLLEEVTNRRFRFHDLVRDYAQERVLSDEPATERDAAVRRELRYYLEHCDHMDRLLAPQRQHVPMDSRSPRSGRVAFDDHAAALAWCDAEIVNLSAAVKQAAERHEYEMAWKIPIALIYYLVVRHHHAYRRDLSVIAVQAARASGDSWAETWALICLGGAEGEVGRHMEATEHFTAALELSRAINDRHWENIALSNLAWTLRLMGRHEEAYTQRMAVLDLQRSEGDRRAEAVSLSELGWLSIALNRPEQALDLCLAALPLTREVSDLLLEADVLHRLGDASSHLHDLEAAADWYGQAIDLRRRVDDGPGLAYSLLELGRVRMRTHRAEARAALTEALRLLELLEDSLASEVRDLLYRFE